MPGPAVDDAHQRAARRPARARTDTGWPPEWRAPFSSRFANARSSWAASARTSGRSRSSASANVGAGAVELVDRGCARPRRASTQSRPRLGRAGLEPREVEQLVDRAATAAAPPRDRRPRARARSASSSARRAERPGGGDDRGQRRAQVVRDRAQQRGLHARRCGAARASRRPRRAARRARARRRAAPRATGRRAPAAAAASPRACRPGTSSVPSWRRPVAQRERDPAGRRRRPAELDRGRRQVERARPAAAPRPAAPSAGRRARSSSRAISAARSASRRRSSASARAPGASVGERAGHERGDEEHAERDPVLAVGDREPAGRRDVEEVERQRAARPPSRCRATRPRPSRRQHARGGRRRRARSPARPRAAGRRASVSSATNAAATTRPMPAGGGVGRSRIDSGRERTLRTLRPGAAVGARSRAVPSRSARAPMNGRNHGARRSLSTARRLTGGCHPGDTPPSGSHAPSA